MSLGSENSNAANSNRKPVAANARNACLAALTSSAQALLRPHIKEAYLPDGSVLWDASRPSADVFFPITGYASVVLSTSGGNAVEIASVGREGAIGIMFEPSGAEPLTRGVVQVGGNFARIPAAQLQVAAQRHDEVHKLVDYCRDWMLAQAQQGAACNAVHSADQRFCRWLAQCIERSDTDAVYSTHETIAAMLGIRRTTVTLVAQKLMADGVIRYRRGNISVLDSQRLRASACDCCASLGRMRWPSTRLAGGAQAARSTG